MSKMISMFFLLSLLYVHTIQQIVECFPPIHGLLEDALIMSAILAYVIGKRAEGIIV
jgi:hypothetical protein